MEKQNNFHRHLFLYQHILFSLEYYFCTLCVESYIECSRLMHGINSLECSRSTYEIIPKNVFALFTFKSVFPQGDVFRTSGM